MAKRRPRVYPWPETIWHSRGSSRTPGFVDGVRKHLQGLKDQGRVVHTCERNWKAQDGGALPSADLSDADPWWVFEAAWYTPDDACVKGQVLVRVDMTAARHLSRHLKEDVDTIAESSTLKLDHLWVITAEADQPWRDTWPSPVQYFFPATGSECWGYDGATGMMRLSGVTSVDLSKKPLKRFVEALRVLSEASWHTVVITHDVRERRITGRTDHPSLVSHLPDSMLGRVVEMRVYGSEDQLVNEILEPYRVSLPWGGAVILPQHPRQEKVRDWEYSVTSPDFGQLLAKTSMAVMRYAAHPPHMPGDLRQGLRSLRAHWSLPELDLPLARVRALQEQAEEDLKKTQEQLALVREDLKATRQELQREREARARLEESAAEVQQMARAGDEGPSPVREEDERLREAWREADEAQGLLDAYAREVGWLRGELAKVPGRSYGEMVPESSPPESWEELAELAGMMSYVRLGDGIWGPLKKIRHHKHSGLWLRHTWECLLALDAYGEAKKKHGAGMLPNFTAYLNWPGATVLVSSTRYCPNDAVITRGGHGDSKWREQRVFRVHGLGEVVMGEHFRIGSGRPPAPRMYVYDDLAGATGLVHIGYLGAHLRNSMTN